MFDLEKINGNEIIPGFYGKFVHGKNITIAFWTVKKGSSIPEHSHINEQSLFVKKGIFKLVMNNKTHLLKKNQLIMIASNIKHSGTAISDCELIDVFSPSRKEYINK